MRVCVWCGKDISVETIAYDNLKYHSWCRKESNKNRNRLRRNRTFKPKISTFVPMTDEEWYNSDLYRETIKRIKKG